MKFTARHKRSTPKKGDTRQLTHFAWSPVYIEGTWVWLEKYVALYYYDVTVYNYKFEGLTKASPVGTWVELAKGTIEK